MHKDPQLAIFHRDSWHCRFCLEPVFFSPMLRLLNGLAPGHGYYHPNGKTGETVDVLTMRHAMAYHLVGPRNDGDDDPTNLATACWKCVMKKPGADAMRQVSDELRSLHWDGFAAAYRHLPGADPEWEMAIGRAAEAHG